MANLRGDLPPENKGGDRRVPVEFGYWWAGRGAVLTIAMVVPGQDEALEPISACMAPSETQSGG